MRNWFIILLLSLFHVNMISATEYNVTLVQTYNKATFPGNRHAPAKLPSIFQDGSIFEVSSLPTDATVEVTFLNDEDETLYYYIGNASSGKFQVSVPASIVEDISKVTLMVNGKTYIGLK